MKKIAIFYATTAITAFMLPSLAQSYTPPQPSLGDDSAYTIEQISEDDYNASGGHNVFMEYESGPNGLIPHYYSYAIKSTAISLPYKDSGFNGQDITGNFFNLNSSNDGGAIRVYSIAGPGNITGDFIGNSVTGSNIYLAGGAIFNYNSTFGNITGDFVGNFLSTSNINYGGAIDNYDGKIGIISGNFIANYSKSLNRNSLGGAIVNEGSGVIEAINGKFIGNYAISSAGSSQANGSLSTAGGGAISNIRNGGPTSGTIKSINADFQNNFAQSNFDVFGGAIYNRDLNLGKINGSFIGNYAKTTHASTLAHGGAIWSNRNLSFVANNVDNSFQGNYTLDSRGKIYNAIYLSGTGLSLDFQATHDGSWNFFDNIEGENPYTINITGDGTGRFVLKNSIINASNINISDTTFRMDRGFYGKGEFINSTPNLTLNNAIFVTANGYNENIRLKNYSSNNSYVHLDVNPDNMTSDTMHFNGNVNGVTKLVIYASSNKDIRNQGSIVFATSENDNAGTEASFEVFRVYKSPYMYDIEYTVNTPTNKEWGLVMNDTENPQPGPGPDPEPDPGTPTDPSIVVVAPEVFAFSALHTASIEQTRSMVGNIRNKVAANKIYSENCCGLYDEYYNGKALYNAWVSPVYHNVHLRNPVDTNAKISGLEAGFDIQQNVNHKLGVFASYRQGQYDVDGQRQIHSNRTNLYSKIDSRIDIDSYLGGLYYRYDKNLFWTFATVYGGIQQADIKTDDGVKADTDGTQLGANIEAGRVYALNPSLTLDPSLGVAYTQIDFNHTKDNVGKGARYKTIRQVEIEVSTKLEKTFWTEYGTTKVYLKPSIIQPITSGSSVVVTGLNKITTYDDNLLGRIEVGARTSIYEALSGYGFAGYTFGKHYDAATFGLGLTYSW